MKKLYFTLLAVLICSLGAFANTVVVKGYVYFANGSAASNVAVYIQTDSLSTPSACMQGHVRYTNANGYYLDSLSCSATITKVRIDVTNCNQGFLTENAQVNTATNVVERNFTLACNLQQTCMANFTGFVSGGGQASFVNNSVTQGSATYTSFWSFGDGTSSTQQNPFHTYAVNGVYVVKLAIASSNGCRDTIIKSLPVTTAGNGGCQAAFYAYPDTINNPLKFFFNSSASVSAGGPQDSIIQRIWSFGDGTGSTAVNPVAPDHIYTSPGTYNVCLKIVSASGCRDSICKTIVVNQPPACQAYFSYNFTSPGTAVFINQSNTLGTNTQYFWTFGNVGSSTAINPTFTFPAAGTYNVCLVTASANGCRDTVCKTVVVTLPVFTPCKAVYAFTGLPTTPATGGYAFQFTSAGSVASSTPGDSIRERIWIWGDGTTATGNQNVISIAKTYTSPGTYNVCLVIRTTSGCSDTTCKTINVPLPNQVSCSAQFTYENLAYTTPPNRPVKFNSSAATASPGDSIISRTWTFGDGTSLTTLDKVVTHNYLQTGTYTVCLTIKTALNCQRTECKLIVVTQSTSACVPHFTWQQTAPKVIAFNSSMSWVPVGDSIVSRTWNFGDATAYLAGNVVSPVHTYQNNGIYTVSLRISTAKNCVQTVSIPVIVRDSGNVTPPTVEPIKIISIYPNPAGAQTQFVVWSQNNNVQAQLAIYDVYGVRKWFTNKVLLQGNNVTTASIAFLPPGPYYIRVTTVYGVKSRAFFKR